MKISAVVSKVASTSLLKINVNAVAAHAKYILSQGVDGYVDEFLDYLMREVNPKELSCSPSWFGELVSIVDKRYPILRLNISQIQYNRESVLHQLRPLPDICRFVSVPDLNALANAEGRCEMVEATCPDQ